MAELQQNTGTQERQARDSYSSQDRGSKCKLNTIEEHESEGEYDRAWLASQDKIKQWLVTPMSDHFPTPRGFHFLPAPILPSSPSSGSYNVSAPWQRNDESDTGDDDDDVSCAGTDSTEFDDLCEVDDDAHTRQLHQTLVSSAKSPPPRLVIPARRDSLPSAVQVGVAFPAHNSKKDQDDLAWMSPSAQQTNSAVQLYPEAIEMMERQQALAVPNISAPPSLDGSLDSEQMAGLSSPPTPIIGPEDSRKNAERATWQGIQLEPAALATLRSLSGDSERDESEEISREEMVEHQQRQRQGQGQMAESGQAPLRLLTTQLNRPQSVGLESPFPTMSAASASRNLTKLEIPSPNTFFANLTPGTRNTWGPSSATTIDNESLNSGTAERFYRAPWEQATTPAAAADGEREPSFYYREWFTSTAPVVEQVIEVPEQTSEDEDQNTAKALNTASTAIFNPQYALRSPRSPYSPRDGYLSPTFEAIEAIEIIMEDDPIQARQRQALALSQLDRTETWLAAQRVYLPTLSEEEPSSEEDSILSQSPSSSSDTIEIKIDLDILPAHSLPPPPPPLFTFPAAKEPVLAPAQNVQQQRQRQQQQSSLAKKKSVRFSELPRSSAENNNNNNNSPCQLPSQLLLRNESAYYRAFMNYMIRHSPNDVFVHRQPRFEALQSQRASLKEAHRCQLLGKYQLSVVPQSLKKRLSANVARGDAELLDDPARLRRDKEAEAAEQMAMSLWHVAAMKFLAGGKLIRAPVAQRLSRLSRMAPGPDGVPRDRARILDLGGQAACDWAWHCAYQYPNTKIYTITTAALKQLSNSNIRGPPNHRQVAVEKLTKLPFENDQFDLISARDLHAILKSSAENGEDEWDLCLQECMRVLKPGGFLEFSILDSDMINPGPRGLAKSVEFGFTLKTLGYDPTPTKPFLSLLSRSGFEDIRRTWVCLPMGEKPASKNRAPVARARARASSGSSSASSPSPSSCGALSAVSTSSSGAAAAAAADVTGGTGAVAAVGGLAAGWSWEKWLLRCETEKVASERRLGIAEAATTGQAVREAAGKCLDDVPSVVEEGRVCGAAWRMLTGWARKPRAGVEVISIGLAE